MLLIGFFGAHLSNILIEIDFFIHENAFETVVCEMAVILSRPQYVYIYWREIWPVQ